MIKISNSSILISGPDGRQEILNLDELEDELWSAGCRINPVAFDEIVKHILVIINDFARQRKSAENKVTRSAIDQLILQILYDSGLHKIADHFAESKNISSQHSDTYIRLDKIYDIVDREAQHLIDQDIISISPVSLLFPVIEIKLHIKKLIDYHRMPYCFELGFFPAFNVTCNMLKQYIVPLKHQINRQENLSMKAVETAIILYANNHIEFLKKSHNELRDIVRFHLSHEKNLRLSIY